MASARCVNCIHWKQEEGRDVGICVMTWVEDGVPSEANSLAIAQSSEEGLWYLQTHKQFGCVQFEERPNIAGSFERTKII